MTSTIPTSRSLRRATTIFWVLLLYILAALIWWFLQLESGNRTIHAAQRSEVKNETAGSAPQLQRIDAEQRRNTVKYASEGLAFLILIVFGASYIYRMLRRQIRFQQQQQNFLMAVTHELKTPIATTRLNLQTLQKHQLDPQRQQSILAVALQETDRLDALINNILISAQLDARSYRPVRESLDLSALVEGELSAFRQRYPSRPVAASIAPGIATQGDALSLRLILSNLLENANKYSPRGADIAVALQPAASGTALTVADNGEGIPEDEKGAVFQKFYRLGSETTRQTKGTGLGLYIARQLAQSHGGTLTVQDNGPKGSIFVCTLPQ